MDALKAELQDALLDSLQGAAWGPALVGRMKTAARAILLRHGLGRATVHIENGPMGVEVAIILPPGPQRVKRLVLHLDG